MRLIRAIWTSCFSLAALEPHSAHADTSGKIFLRGYVPQRAVISISAFTVVDGNRGATVPGAPSRMAFDITPTPNGPGVAVFHLDRLANSNSGFVVKLEADSVDGAGPKLISADGTAIPYKVRFAGRDIDLGSGNADLATVTRQTEDDEASGRFEIIAPPITGAARSYSDHIVLVVAAR